MKKHQKSQKIIIKITKISTGHKPHTTGSGVHKDKRLKRLHTRANRNIKEINESKDI